MALRTSAGIEEELRPRSPLLSEHVGSIFVKVPAVTSAEIVEGAVMLCYNEKTFLEDQEFRQNLSKFLVASSNIQRFKNTVSIETSLSVILRTSVYMASRMKSVMVGARNKKGMQHIQLKNISTLFWDYFSAS
ncbi:hypothetical protein CYMTET_15165 [Cymbomonas tetramitiformis]|uniref:Uncharacterized protein n=1 Tax=Cymbomonas tetramitiformis TaxID=36881 RepID=A0AAE0C7A1_9CHLO|nr:hypothetical protein CYMTET_40898 [Cymbomonas tetramitiformis]KAK3276791.1 hypothetical protein CYMTET_15165 [Cymbomonas tetramitiformis]